MPRLPLFAALLLALLSLVSAPLAVAAPSAPVASVATDDEWGDWEDCDAECEDDGMCVVAGEWDEEETVASDEEEDDWSEDDGEWSDDEWCDEDEDDWSDEEDEEEETAPAVRLSRLHATTARLGAVLVTFRLDRGSRVTLTLQRLGAAARASGKPQSVRGAVDLTGRRGANETTLRRWKGRALQPGRYRLTATPASGRAATTAFTLRVAARRA